MKYKFPKESELTEFANGRITVRHADGNTESYPNRKLFNDKYDYEWFPQKASTAKESLKAEKLISPPPIKPVELPISKY